MDIGERQRYRHWGSEGKVLYKNIYVYSIVIQILMFLFNFL